MPLRPLWTCTAGIHLIKYLRGKKCGVPISIAPWFPIRSTAAILYDKAPTNDIKNFHWLGLARSGMHRCIGLSLKKQPRSPLDIRYLKLAELDFDRPLDPLQSTEFTYSRFLVPYLCQYEGKAIFMDCDRLCLGDIKELDDLEMSQYALRVVKHNHRPTEKLKIDGKIQTVYPRKNWSSLMIMNCQELKLGPKK